MLMSSKSWLDLLSGGHWRFLVWALHHDHRSGVANDVGWVHPKVFIGLTSVKAQISYILS